MNTSNAAKSKPSQKSQNLSQEFNPENMHKDCMPNHFILVDALFCKVEIKEGVTKSGRNAGKPYKLLNQTVFYSSPQYPTPKPVTLTVNQPIEPGKYAIFYHAIKVKNAVEFGSLDASLELVINQLPRGDTPPTIVKISDDLN